MRHVMGTLVALSLFAAAPAWASLMGTTVTSSVASSGGLSVVPGSATVGAGVEFLYRNGPAFAPFSGDVGATSFTFAAVDGCFCGASDLEISVTFVESILGISVTLAPAAGALELADFSFSGQTLNIAVGAGAFSPGLLATVDLTFVPPSQVPAPATLALVAAGLLGLGASRGRRVRAA